MLIGKIARSSSHIDYVCQIYQAGDVADPPPPEAYAFGTFVRITLDEERAIVGLIYDTILMNPDFGALGPRLSPIEELAIFSPDYLNEKATLAGIVAVGTRNADGLLVHGVPLQTARIDAPVKSMGDEAVAAFHSDGSGGVRIGYAPLLIAHASPLARYLLLNIIERLEALYPQAGAQLQVLKANVAWRTTVEPLG
jgi:hypothetical protein